MKKLYTVEPLGESKPKVPGLCSYRWAVSFVGFFGCVFITALRVDFSLAIVCMVKTPNRTSDKLGNITTTTERPFTGRMIYDDVNNDIDNGTDITNEIGCTANSVVESLDTDVGEFEWNKHLQSEMLAAFFYGYILCQILGGWLARKYGCRLVLGIGVLMCAISTLLLPVCARTHIYLVFAIRFIAGLGTSVCLPALYTLWGRWAPPLERTKLTSVCMSGIPMGIIVSMALSGYLCKYGFDNGWGAIFYVFGAASMVWLVLWFYVVYDSPGDHPRISAVELAYIQNSMEDSASHTDTEHKTPWLAIFKSRSLWVVAFAHFCTNWLNLTLATDLPTYMKEVLKYDVKANGLLSSVPYIVNTATCILAGVIADIIRRKQLLSTTATRRTFQAFGMLFIINFCFKLVLPYVALLGAGTFLVVAGFVDCDSRWQAVLFLTIANGFLGFTRAGCMVNHVDFGRRYAGELYGITNTIANAPGMVVPIVNGELTPNGTRREWLYVFILCGCLCILGTLVFSSMARGTPEPWATTTTTVELEDTAGDMSKTQSNETSDVPLEISSDTTDSFANHLLKY